MTKKKKNQVYKNTQRTISETRIQTLALSWSYQSKKSSLFAKPADNAHISYAWVHTGIGCVLSAIYTRMKYMQWKYVACLLHLFRPARSPPDSPKWNIYIFAIEVYIDNMMTKNWCKLLRPKVQPVAFAYGQISFLVYCIPCNFVDGTHRTDVTIDRWWPFYFLSSNPVTIDSHLTICCIYSWVPMVTIDKITRYIPIFCDTFHDFTVDSGSFIVS